MKIYIFTIVFCFGIGIVSAQDLIYTVSGEIDENKTSLDSILVKNISNDTRILFDDLPALEYYQINLTKEAFWGSVGIMFIDEPPAFNVAENSPGSLTIAYLKNFSTDVKLAVYNINGQKVFASERKILNPGNSIRVQLSSTGVFIVKLEAQFGIHNFKTIGANNVKGFNVEISDKTITNVILKSETNSSDTDFSYIPGDSILISVYKNGYIATPHAMKIDSSEFVNFMFEENSTGVVGTLADARDGRTYKTITINGKEWMTENMAYLPSVSLVSSFSTTESVYYVYDYNDTIVSEAKETDNYKLYGVLYNGPAAIATCPSGWHLPTDEEWEQMVEFISEKNGGYDKLGTIWYNVGKHLKAIGTIDDGDGLWIKADTEDAGIDDYVFSGLPGGYRNHNVFFEYIGKYGCWWTSTELSSPLMYYRYLSFDNTNFTRGYYPQDCGFSVRYVKD